MKNNTLLFISLVFALLLSSCSLENIYSASIEPTLKVTGDVEAEVELETSEGYDVVDYIYNDEKVKAISLQSVLKSAAPVGNELSIFLCSNDGVMARIPISEIDEECMLFMTDENGWVFNSPNHPKLSGIKRMDKIVVCSEESVINQNCFRMIYGKKYLTRTYGQLFYEDALVYSVLEGKAKQNGYTADAYTRRQLIALSSFTEELGAQDEKNAIAYFADGSSREIGLDGYIEWRGTSADYIGSDMKAREADIIGVWIDAPNLSITDIASIAIDKLNEGNVLIIEMDGLGYYNIAEHQPEYISSKNISMMRTVMPSISNVSLAAIVTGQEPKVNGVTERGNRNLNVYDMFKKAKEQGAECAVVEGDTVLVSMSIEQTLNVDTNNDGYTDNEVLESALKKIDEGYNFIYVHFHGFDDTAHTFGPSSDEAAQKAEEIDRYVKTLCEHFSGTVIITADHGQHDTKDEGKLGNHGEFLPVDMIVPFIIFEVN
ncbi:MAG: alkaline phosphatase family protein [Eubacteriales bacterium]